MPFCIHSCFGLCLREKMEIILDELQKNNVDIDMRTLSHHVNYLLNKHGDIYQSIVLRCPDLVTIFYEIDAINFGRAMAYLTLVYLTKVSEVEIRVAVQLVAKRLRGFDFAKFKIEESFFDKIMPIFQRLFSS